MKTMIGMQPDTRIGSGVRPRVAVHIPPARRVTPAQVAQLRAYYGSQREPHRRRLRPAGPTFLDQAKAALAVAALLGCALILSACGGAEPERRELAPVVELQDEGIPEYTEAERAEAAEFMRGIVPMGGELFFDDPEAYGPAPKAEGALVEKASWAVLTGWSMMANLAEQDGRNTEGWPEGDHCSLYGLSCNGEVHAQARKTFLSGTDDEFEQEFLVGGCGSDKVDSSIGLSSLFMPCASAFLTGSDRELTWSFDESTCPNEAAGRRALRDGIVSAQAYFNRFTSVAMREVPVGSAEIDFFCNNDLPAETAARWTPAGALTLRYGGLKAGGDLTAIFGESCETSGLPGSRNGGTPAANYRVAPDFMYTYAQGFIGLHWNAQFAKIAECTSDPVIMARIWSTTVRHELGHHLGFHHEEFDDDDFGLMSAGGIACERLADRTRGFDDAHLLALLSQDVDPNAQGGRLELWDVDLSCYEPSY